MRRRGSAILDAAIVRFGRDGYRATSVADIARDASVGGTVAYAYFPSKEALFLTAVDEDAAAVIREGLSAAMGIPNAPDWRQMLIFSLSGPSNRHPLARRLLAGLEPDVTERVLGIPALAEFARRVPSDCRPSKSAVRSAPTSTRHPRQRVVAIMLSLLMSVVQVGRNAAILYGADVATVFEAALTPPPASNTGRPKCAPRPVAPVLAWMTTWPGGNRVIAASRLVAVQPAANCSRPSCKVSVVSGIWLAWADIAARLRSS